MKRAVPALLALSLLVCGPLRAEKTLDAASESADNPELARMYEEDQKDRESHDIDWSLVSKRDEERRARVRELIAAGRLATGRDHYHAAMVFQHGMGVEDYALARDLARKAYELDPELKEAKWLSAAAHDRWLHRQGKPQIYGTQFQRPGGKGPWTMEPFDRAAVTDEERKEHGIPPIAEQEKRMAEMNRRLAEEEKKDEHPR